MNWISILFGHSLMFRVSGQPTSRLGVIKVTNRNATQFNDRIRDLSNDLDSHPQQQHIRLSMAFSAK